MRPRGRGYDVDDDEDELSPQRSAPEAEPEPVQPPPPQPARAPLSSLVVRPPPQENGASSPAAAAARSSSSPAGDAPGRRRGSSLPRRRHDLSPPDPRGRERRRSPPPPVRRRPGTPPPQRRRFSPPGFQPRYPRFHDEPQVGLPISIPCGWRYGMHAGPSPPRQHRLESSNFDDAIGPRYTHGYQGSGRGGTRFRDGSPPYGRGGRSYGRGYSAPGKEFINIDGEYVHRNDPNLSPREGDWICKNPNCGNLNFARRTHCNNCNSYRYESGHSPHRGYFNSPRGPPRILGPPSDRAPPREMGRYRSPTRGSGVGDPRGYAARSPPDRAGRFPDPLQREKMGFRGDRASRDRVKFEWSAAEYNQRGERQHDGLYLDRSRRRSGSPRGNWGRDMRDRSRSPAGSRPPVKSSFTGRGRPDLDYAGSYVSRGRPNNLDAGRGRGRGRGYRPGGDPYPGEGRGGRHAAPHGRSEGYY